MALSTWWRGDSLPQLPSIPGCRVSRGGRVDVLSRLMRLSEREITDRLTAGNSAYVASMDGTPAAYGWVATITASIGELDLDFTVAAGDRYLWDFVTLPEWRGRGIYPWLLQEIIRQEYAADRFWIIHAPENAASRNGIARAGFVLVSNLAFRPDRSVAASVAQVHQRAKLGAALLGVPLLEAVENGRVVSPCWRCVMLGKYRSDGEAPCWPNGNGTAADCSCIVPAVTR